MHLISSWMTLSCRCAYLDDIGQNPFYRALRRLYSLSLCSVLLLRVFSNRAMDSDWKYMSVGVSVSVGVLFLLCV